MSVALLDDQTLGAVLRGATPRAIRRFELATTGHWYVRLCQAVLTTAERRGMLSGPFADLPAGPREQALAAVLELPPDITLVSLRELAPAIGRLRQRHELNILGIEALAASLHLEAEVVLSARSPRLEAALDIEGCRCRLVDIAS